MSNHSPERPRRACSFCGCTTALNPTLVVFDGRPELPVANRSTASDDLANTAYGCAGSATSSSMFGCSVISIRRLCALPSVVSFPATGSNSP